METGKILWIVLNFPTMIFSRILLHVFLQILKTLIDFLDGFRFKPAILDYFLPLLIRQPLIRIFVGITKMQC